MDSFLLSIDDTDNLDSPGTGHVLADIGDILESKGLGIPSRISRHQLFVHPDVPYTSHNSAMCTILTGVTDQKNLISVVEAELISRAAEGSDPGICCVAEHAILDTGPLLAWGKRAKRELLTKDEAYSTARSCGLYLNELGGTGDGIIGALAGVSLRLGGSDGRFRGRIPVAPGTDNFSVAELLALPEVDTVINIETRENVPLEDIVIRPVDIKTVLLNGRSVLPVRSFENVWRCLSRAETKEMFS